MIRTFLLLLFTFFCGAAFSQTGVKGKLIDQSENNPLEYASVSVYQLKDSTFAAGMVTGQDGTFIIENLKSGDYYLLAQYLGYEIKTISEIRISKNQMLDLGTIFLSPDHQLLAEVEVSGKKFTTMNQVDR